MSSRSRIGVSIVRILFGVIWAIDAYFKWQPSFLSDFTGYLEGALSGQPAPVQGWINFWLDIVKVDPSFFAHVVAVGETGLALLLILGALSNAAYAGGILLSLVIWSTAEGLGGPYVPGSTDVGTAIIYVLVFALLLLTRAGMTWGVDRVLSPRLGRWAFLASGRSRTTPESDGRTNDWAQAHNTGART